MNTEIVIQNADDHLPHFCSSKWGRQEGVEQRCIVAYLDGLAPIGDLRQANVNALRELQSQTQEELDPLLSLLDKAFKEDAGGVASSARALSPMGAISRCGFMR